MDLKEYERLAALLDEPDTPETAGRERLAGIPEGGKLKFFWEKCHPEQPDVASIIKRSRRKIEREAARRRKKYFWLASVSVAASVIVCISFIRFFRTDTTERPDLQALAEQIDTCTFDRVTLVTPAKRLDIPENAFIRYTKEGEITVGTELVTQAKPCGSRAEEYDRLLVPAGKRAKIRLPDGTLLTVNSQSQVVFPRRFAGSVRKIYVQGEVFLDVAHDKEHPFWVESDGFDLQVLGTRFNVSAYRGDDARIVLVEGSVEVTDRHEKKARLVPCDLLCITGGAIASCEQVDVDKYIGWVEGILLLNGKELMQIIRNLSLYYGTEIYCDPALGGRKVYGKLDLKDDVGDVLECIRQTVPFEITRNDAGIFLHSER